MSIVVKFLEQSYLKNRLSHLYLLVGPKGSGKYRAAVETAHLLLSNGKKDAHTLDLINRNEHVNFFHIEKEGQNIKKQQIINLQEEFSKTSLQSGSRIYVISDIEALSSSAANSLLKFMEEPESKNTFGFLLTSNIEQILPTIISRSQVLKMSLDNEDDVIFKLLNEGISESLSYNAILLTKDYDEAYKISNNDSYIKIIELWFEIVSNIGNKQFLLPIQLDAFRNIFNEDRSYFKYFLECILVYLKDLIYTYDNANTYYKYLEELMRQTIDKIDYENLSSVINKIQILIKNQNSNVNIDLAIDIFNLNMLPLFR